ncbi:helix-turn-helix transcriptional regulator [Chitinophaga sp.]|uniref:helix-turn-helix transcriptional regulator n=1 Tax=Chitinophaga sp. TaxID=1869181 RepID=UPI002F91FDEB
MITTRRLQVCLFILLLGICPGKAVCQDILIDSLRKALTSDTQPESRIMTTAKLARALFYKNAHEAIHLEQQALVMGNSLKDGQYKAFTYGTLAYLYDQVKDYAAVHTAIDSALYYAGRTDNKLVKGFVWLRKGILEFSDEKYDQSMASLLKSLQLLEGKEAYNYENIAYYYIAGIYWSNHDIDNYNKFIRLSWQTALKSNDPDDLCRGYQALGNAFLERYRADTAAHALLDSALHYNNRCLEVARQQEGRIVFSNTAAVAALNNGDIYFEYYPSAYKDSAEKYINIALTIAGKIGYPEIVANCYGILSEYALKEGRYSEAEKILLMGLAKAEEDSTTRDFTKARMLSGLARVAEQSGSTAKALQYYKDYMKYDKAYFNSSKLTSINKLAAQYESDQKEQALAALKEKAAFNKHLNFIYFCLIIVGLIAFVFLFRSYHFRLKAAKQRQLLLAKEKEDADLQSQLEARLREEEAARLQAEQELLLERQQRLNKELLAGTLRVQEKSELLLTLRNKITGEAGNSNILRQMDRIISEDQRLDEDFETLKSDFAEIHPDFFSQLQQKAQNSLTRLDLKYCSYILMGLSNKEVAMRLGIAPKSIRMARYRIKQKLGLEKDQQLDQYIQSLA